MGIYLRRAVLNKLQLRGRRRSIFLPFLLYLFPRPRSAPGPPLSSPYPPIPSRPSPPPPRYRTSNVVPPGVLCGVYGAVFGIVPTAPGRSAERARRRLGDYKRMLRRDEGERGERDRERDKSPFPISSDVHARSARDCARDDIPTYKYSFNTRLNKVLRGTANRTLLAIMRQKVPRLILLDRDARVLIFTTSRLSEW